MEAIAAYSSELIVKSHYVIVFWWCETERGNNKLGCTDVLLSGRSSVMKMLFGYFCTEIVTKSVSFVSPLKSS